MGNEANRNTRAPLPRPDQRDLGPADTGNRARDGYTVLARRPRVAGYTDLMKPERAAGIEDSYRSFRDEFPYYDD